VSEIVCQCNDLREVLVQSDGARQVSCDLGDLQRVRQPSSEVVLFMRHENLRLEVQTSEGRAVDNPIAIPLEACAVGVFSFRAATPPVLLFVYSARQPGTTL